MQYHPEASPGPHDARYLFARFRELVEPAAGAPRRSVAVPRRNDLHKILIIGSGPIVIGQACEFDYSGTQACKVLAAEGYEVVLVNSNPATIMTDPDFAARTYIEPLDPDTRRRASSRSSGRTRCCPRWAARRPSTWPWSCTSAACSSLWGVEMIGANAEAIAPRRGPRADSATAIEALGLRVPRSAVAHTSAEAEQARRRARPAARRAPRLHAGRQRRRHRPRRRGAAAHRRRRACASAPSARSCSRSRSSAGTSSSSR